MSAPIKLAAFVATIVAAGPSCSRHHGDGEAELRARRATAEFVRFGAGSYQLITFSADPERVLGFTDDYDQTTSVYEVPFVARIRFVTAVAIPGDASRKARIGREGWTLGELEHDVQAALLFGAGAHAPGDELDVEGAAVFDRLETGWRFRCLDRIR